IDMLRSQATSYNGALRALESRCPNRLITPEVADQAEALRAQHDRISSAIGTAWELASNAAQGASADFLTASVFNTTDLKIIAAYGKDHPEKIPGLVFGGAALVGLPQDLVAGMSTAEIDAELAGILAATESAAEGGAVITAEGVGAFAGRLLLRG